MYTVAVFRHTRRGHQISLQMVVSHHVAGMWTQDLRKSSQFSQPLSHPYFSKLKSPFNSDERYPESCLISKASSVYISGDWQCNTVSLCEQ